MKGDVVLIEEHHRRVATRITQAISGRLQSKQGRFALSVAGESGSGKSETAAALAEELGRRLFPAVVLGQDDYYVLPPRSNDARRRQDPDWLGPHAEVRLDLLQANVDSALSGASSIEKPVIDYDANRVATEELSLEGVKVVIAEGTYVSLLRNLDVRVFIARNRVDTLAHREKRNRGSEVGDPFIERVLTVEHKIIAGHRHLADFVVTRGYDVFERDSGEGRSCR